MNAISQTRPKKIQLYRVCMPDHECPLGLQAVKFLRERNLTLSASQISPTQVYINKYCPRSEMENLIKQHQLDLFSCRTLTQTFESNQLRIWLSSMLILITEPV